MKNIKELKKGDWIFSCYMKPLQFKKWQDNEGFETLEGTTHGISSCGCIPISKKYAKWFIDNNIDKLYNKHREKENAFDLYELEVKSICIKENILYEGI